MVLHRILLTGLIALGLAMAPVATALAASHAPAKAAMDDCHGKLAKHCDCCDKATCTPELCALTCHQLVGTLPASLVLLAIIVPFAQPVEPQKPPDRFERPHPPPPRS